MSQENFCGEEIGAKNWEQGKRGVTSSKLPFFPPSSISPTLRLCQKLGPNGRGGGWRRGKKERGEEEKKEDSPAAPPGTPPFSGIWLHLPPIRNTVPCCARLHEEFTGGAECSQGILLNGRSTGTYANFSQRFFPGDGLTNSDPTYFPIS